MMKSKATNIEIGCIVGIAMIAYACAHRFLPRALQAGEIVMAFAGLLLAQSLIRDLARFRLKSRGQTPAPQHPPAKSCCLCAESVMGIAGIASGALLLIPAVAPKSLPIAPLGWAALICATGSVGLLLKNLTVDWNRCRIARDDRAHDCVITWRIRKDE